MSFTQYDYFVHENESSVEVCLELFGITGTLQEEVLLEFSTSDNTSIGEGGRERGGWRDERELGREGEREGGRERGGGRKEGEQESYRGRDEVE